MEFHIENSYVYGGAICNEWGTLTLTNSNFENNYTTSTGKSGEFGGAIYIEEGTLTINADDATSLFNGNYTSATYGDKKTGDVNAMLTAYCYSSVEEMALNWGYTSVEEMLTVYGYSSVEGMAVSWGYYSFEVLSEEKDYNAIYSNGGTINLNAVNNGVITFNDNIRGVDYKLNVTGDETGTLNMHNTILNSKKIN